jgi:hypothetical protein
MPGLGIGVIGLLFPVAYALAAFLVIYWAVRFAIRHERNRGR